MPFARNTGPIKPHHSAGETARKAVEKTNPPKQPTVTEVLDLAKQLNISLANIERLTDELAVKFAAHVEQAFRSYCRAHSAPKELEDLEWERFSKFL